MILGVDLDSVCADYVSAFRWVVARAKGVPPYSLTDNHSWDFTEWGIESREEFLSLHALAVDEGIFATMPPIEGCSEALWRLSDADVHIRIITHRLGLKGSHGVIAGDTVRWLEKENIPYRDLCFMGDKPQVEADIYVDDAPHNIKALQDADKDVIIFSQPYNRHMRSRHGMRAFDWQDVEDIVREGL